jgi:hypothetical protein
MDGTSPELQRALERLMRLHPHARMWGHGEVGADHVEGESEDQSFISVFLYEHDITEHFRPLNGYKFIISNGFLASHAYNLALVWLQGLGDRALRRARLRHNFKKFYAETILYARDVMIGRALLLETLAYEQELMAPIFDAAKADPNLSKRADTLASAMTGIAQHHELGHYFYRRSPAEFTSEMSKFLGGCLEPVVDDLRQQYADDHVEEVICDGVAAHFGILGDDQNRLSNADLTARLRRTAFGLQAFYRLMDLRASARVTAKEYPDDAVAINLGSEIRPKDQPVYSVGHQPEVQFRSGALTQMLSAFAEHYSLPLYGDDGDFPLSPEAWEDFDHAFEHFGDEAPPGTLSHLGCDARGRSIMRIVAEALSHHPEGTEHLLWRSKSFKRGSTPVDP